MNDRQVLYAGFGLTLLVAIASWGWTVNKLAEVGSTLAQAIERVDRRVDRLEAKVDAKFDAIEKRLDRLEARFDRYDEKLNEIIIQLRLHDKRLGTLEGKVK